MADLGIHGLGAAPEGMDRLAHRHAVFDHFGDVFSTAWISDHLQFEGEPLSEAWTFMTWLAATFPRLRIGSMVLSQSYRNPGLLGAMAQTFSRAIRREVGSRTRPLAGSKTNTEPSTTTIPGRAYVVAQLAETIELLKTLWSNSPANYEGQWHRLDGALCKQPDPPIPIMVGTNGPRALKVVARLADWWVWDGPWRRPIELLTSSFVPSASRSGGPSMTSRWSVSSPSHCRTTRRSSPDRPSTRSTPVRCLALPGRHRPT